MTAKEYLQSIGDSEKAIKTKVAMIENLQGVRYRITQVLKTDVVSGGEKRGGFSDASDALLDLEKELSAEIKKYAATIREAEKLLEEVRNKSYYDVLKKHYLEGKSLRTIAAEMGYCKRNVSYILKNALKIFQRILDARES